MSDITITNDALNQIGVPSITDWTDETNERKVAQTMYAVARDALLRMHTWGFATKRVALALVDPVTVGTGNRFTLPSDCLRVVELVGSVSSYSIEGRELITADGAASIKYIKQETDTAKYDSLFTEIFALYLAYRLAYPLKRDLALSQAKYGQFGEALNKAKSIDLNEEVPVDIISKAYVLLGAPAITNFDDSRLQTAFRIYEKARDEVLKSYAWNFAIVRSGELTATTTPNFEYAYAHTLPAACLRVLEVDNSVYNWKVEAAVILSNALVVKIRYITQITDITKFSPEFTNALVYNLASKLAPMIGQPSLLQPNYELYKQTVMDARATDGKENGSDIIIAKALLSLGVESPSVLDSEKALIVNSTYGTAREFVLSVHPWNFAIMRSPALVEFSIPEFEYDHVYSLPPDCLRVLEIYSDLEPSAKSWRVETTLLLTDETNVKIRYIQKFINADLFSPAFTEALVYYLASKLASVVGKPELSVPKYELYQRALLDARLSDSQEGAAEVIIAKALLLLGINSINHLDNEKATTCTKLYETTRDNTLRAHTWNFAIKRSTALTGATAPAFGYTYAFELPSDCLRVVEVYNSIYPWRVEGGLLLTSISSIKIKYIARMTDVSDFSASFENSLTFNLASQLAFPVTGKVDLVQLYDKLYNESIAQARVLEAAEAMPVTDTVNMALTLIGAGSISALDDQQIRLIEKLYTPTLKETLAAHTWNFATSRAVLVEATPVPTFGFDHKFTLPTDCLTIVELYDSDSEWKIEGGFLLTDDDTASVIYIANITDTTKFSATFNTALMYHLASKFAVPMAKDKGLQKQNYELYINTCAGARSIDSREGTADELQSNTLIDARR